MNYHEFKKAWDDGDVREGDRVWVCCLYFRNVLQKPSRNLRPTECALATVEYDWRFYETFHLVDPYDPENLNKVTPVRTNISDNEALPSFFATKEECVEAYRMMCDEAAKQLEKARADVEKKLAATEALIEKNRNMVG